MGVGPTALPPRYTLGEAKTATERLTNPSGRAFKPFQMGSPRPTTRTCISNLRVPTSARSFVRTICKDAKVSIPLNTTRPRTCATLQMGSSRAVIIGTMTTITSKCPTICIETTATPSMGRRTDPACRIGETTPSSPYGSTECCGASRRSGGDLDAPATPSMWGRSSRRAWTRLPRGPAFECFPVAASHIRPRRRRRRRPLSSSTCPLMALCTTTRRAPMNSCGLPPTCARGTLDSKTPRSGTRSRVKTHIRSSVGASKPTIHTQTQSAGRTVPSLMKRRRTDAMSANDAFA